jgi:ABC-type transport system involved in cytochrome c biogenesis permease subunit
MTVRLLGFLGLLLNAGIVYFAVVLFSSAEKGAAPTRIVVPFEEEQTLWRPYRRWQVQEDGRIKPFDTFCREAVRTITGREKFETVRSATGRVIVEGHDPVAVIVSWMLLEDGRGPLCDWEQHPFVLCPNREVRWRLYGEDRPGQHAEPAVLRKSKAFADVCDEASSKMAKSRNAILTAVERQALEVRCRLDLYDLIRAGGAEEDGDNPSKPGPRFIALDRHGEAWFSLKSVLAFTGRKGTENWRRALNARRLDDPPSYEGQPLQTCSSGEIESVLAAWTELQTSYRSSAAERFAEASDHFLAATERVNRQFQNHPAADATDLELWFNRASPFRKAWLFSLLSAFLCAGSLAGLSWPRVSRVLYALGLCLIAGSLIWAAVGFYCRVSISGRAPVSNMYESIVWVAAMAAAFGLLLEAIWRRGVIVLAAALVSTLGFVLADQLPLTFSPSIQPLQAVLRSNYWLVIHVLTIVSSYAPLSLAWALGNLNLALILFTPKRRDLIASLSQRCYRCIQVGVLLLFLGTMLGGFWAAESWGRFWGWDPKEVWALIAFLCYIIPLHARYAGWLADFGLAACSVVCFSSVVMAWYGVNFVLGAGLHSYGFGSGEHTAIYLAGLVNISLVVHAAMRYCGGGRRTASTSPRPAVGSAQAGIGPNQPAALVEPLAGQP